MHFLELVKIATIKRHYLRYYILLLCSPLKLEIYYLKEKDSNTLSIFRRYQQRRSPEITNIWPYYAKV